MSSFAVELPPETGAVVAADSSANRIAYVRERKGLKQTELAQRLGKSRGQIANMEAGTREVNLRELRKIAQILECQVVELLLPQDATNLPEGNEAVLLEEMRKIGPYDPRTIIVACRAVLEATKAITQVAAAPATLAGDPRLAAALTDRWDMLDDAGRRHMLQLLDTARAFSR